MPTKYIYLLPMGEVKKDFGLALVERLSHLLGIPFMLAPAVERPEYALHPIRVQYDASKILERIAEQVPIDGVRLIGLTNVDLCH